MELICTNSSSTEFIMLVGLPSSGKSTYIKKYLAKDAKDFNIHSSNAISEGLSGDNSIQDLNAEVSEMLHKRIREDLKNGISCVYDATNISWKRRKAFLNSLTKINCWKSCHIIATPYEECLAQNKQRNSVVPEQVIKKMYMNFDIPFYNEGWDDIKIIYLKPDYEYKYGYWLNFILESIEFDQDSKWHSKTLGKHCRDCYFHVFSKQNFLKKAIYRETVYAAALHDCGKSFCKIFKDAYGNKSQYAHYYNHENVSCYNVLFYEMEPEVDKLFVSALIRWHMVLHFFKNWPQKAIDKYEKEFTSNKYLEEVDFYSALKLLHEGDKNAR